MEEEEEEEEDEDEEDKDADLEEVAPVAAPATRKALARRVRRTSLYQTTARDLQEKEYDRGLGGKHKATGRASAGSKRRRRDLDSESASDPESVDDADGGGGVAPGDALGPAYRTKIGPYRPVWWT